jgi:hypothetical protein
VEASAPDRPVNGSKSRTVATGYAPVPHSVDFPGRAAYLARTANPNLLREVTSAQVASSSSGRPADVDVSNAYLNAAGDRVPEKLNLRQKNRARKNWKRLLLRTPRVLKLDRTGAALREHCARFRTYGVSVGTQTEQQGDLQQIREAELRLLSTSFLLAQAVHNARLGPEDPSPEPSAPEEEQEEEEEEEESEPLQEERGHRIGVILLPLKAGLFLAGAIFRGGTAAAALLLRIPDIRRSVANIAVYHLRDRVWTLAGAPGLTRGATTLAAAGFVLQNLPVGRILETLIEWGTQ